MKLPDMWPAAGLFHCTKQPVVRRTLLAAKLCSWWSCGLPHRMVSKAQLLVKVLRFDSFAGISIRCFQW